MLPALLAAVAAVAVTATSNSGSACYAVGNNAYLVGGNAGLTVVDLASELDPYTAPVGEELQRTHHASARHGEHIYIVGGRSRAKLVAGMVRLNTEDLTVEALHPAGGGPEPREYMSAAFVGDKMYVVGGRGQDGRCSGDAWEYDPKANAWAKLPLDLGARYGHTAVGVNSTLYLFGGKADAACSAESGNVAIDLAAARPRSRELGGPADLLHHSAALQYPHMVFLGLASRHFYNFEGNTWVADEAADGVERSTHCLLARGKDEAGLRLAVLSHGDASAKTSTVVLSVPLPQAVPAKPPQSTPPPTSAPSKPAQGGSGSGGATVLPISGSPFIEMQCRPAECQRKILSELPRKPECSACSACPQACGSCTERVTPLVASFEVRAECEINRLRGKKERAKCTDKCEKSVLEWKKQVKAELTKNKINCKQIDENIERLTKTVESAAGLETGVNDILNINDLSTQLRTVLEGHRNAKELYCTPETAEVREGFEESYIETSEAVERDISKAILLKVEFATKLKALLAEYEGKLGLNGDELDGHCVELAKEFINDARASPYSEPTCNVTHNIRCELKAADATGKPARPAATKDCPCP